MVQELDLYENHLTCIMPPTIPQAIENLFAMTTLYYSITNLLNLQVIYLFLFWALHHMYLYFIVLFWALCHINLYFIILFWALCHMYVYFIILFCALCHMYL